MLEKLDQMMEISKALDAALDKGDVDRVVSLLKHRRELTDRMGPADPKDPDVASGAVAEKLKILVTMDGALEAKMKDLMTVLKDAIKAVKGEQQVVRGYVKQSIETEPKYLDKEG